MNNSKVPSVPGHPPTLAPAFPRPPSWSLQQGLFLTRSSNGTARAPGVSASYAESGPHKMWSMEKGMANSFLEKPMYEKAEGYDTEMNLPHQ